MKYVCLVHFTPEALSSLSDEEKRTLDARSIAYDEELAASGRLVAAEALQSLDSAVLVKVRAGKISTTDRRALELTTQEPERRLLERRSREVEGPC
ncbi:YciI family protein [Sorangium sp. So ce1014]|uniref:YciI family protein n=1 Tax=Sorangium sp. So ce1014 TaxID=3133326 RepID=UPI003F61D55A